MKKGIFIILAIFVFFNVNYANQGYVKGVIKYIRYHDSNYGEPKWADDFWILVDATPTTTCNCAKYNELTYGGGGGYLFHIDGTNKNFVAFILTAKNSGQEVSINYDDTKKDTDGYCYIQYIGF